MWTDNCLGWRSILVSLGLEIVYLIWITRNGSLLLRSITRKDDRWCHCFSVDICFVRIIGNLSSNKEEVIHYYPSWYKDMVRISSRHWQILKFWITYIKYLQNRKPHWCMVSGRVSHFYIGLGMLKTCKKPAHAPKALMAKNNMVVTSSKGIFWVTRTSNPGR